MESPTFVEKPEIVILDEGKLVQLIVLYINHKKQIIKIRKFIFYQDIAGDILFLHQKLILGLILMHLNN